MQIRDVAFQFGVHLFRGRATWTLFFGRGERIDFPSEFELRWIERGVMGIIGMISIELDSASSPLANPSTLGPGVLHWTEAKCSWTDGRLDGVSFIHVRSLIYSFSAFTSATLTDLTKHSPLRMPVIIGWSKDITPIRWIATDGIRLQMNHQRGQPINKSIEHPTQIRWPSFYLWKADRRINGDCLQRNLHFQMVPIQILWATFLEQLSTTRSGQSSAKMQIRGQTLVRSGMQCCSM